MKYIVGTDVKKSKIIYETLYNIFSVFKDWNWNVIAFGVVTFIQFPYFLEVHFEAWIVMLGTFKWIAQNYPQYKLIKSCGPLIVSILGIIVMVAFPDLEDDKGIEIVSVYDRAPLIEGAVEYLVEKLIEEAIVVALISFIFLLHVRSAFVAIVTLPLGVLAALS